MVDLRTLKKHEVFLTMKRDLAMVRISTCYSLCFLLKNSSNWESNCFFFFFVFLQAIQTSHLTKEWVDHAHFKLKDKEARRVSAIKNLALVKKNNKDLVTKLTESNKERKSAEAALAGAKKQAKDQR